MKNTFIFDYDDTLAPNQCYYCDAKIEFQRYVRTKIGNKAPDVQAIINLHTEIDLELLKTMGLSRRRFPTSFSETFKQIAESRNYPYTEQELNEVYMLANAAFDINPGLEKGAEEVLDFLAAKGDELLLYTKGDKKIQQKKIDLNQLQKWFQPENIHIVDDKNSTDLEKIVGDRDKDRTYKVGNSIRSDINPALEAGIKVIYIPCETWAYEQQHNGIDASDPRIFVFNELTAIIKNYEGL
ncbi:hypothetical protein GOV06_03930 [Candidatus Woesearchaeota archaeon]|nr:hypothetical protein [Candidatus Woesearchaeota archaeon]